MFRSKPPLDAIEIVARLLIVGLVILTVMAVANILAQIVYTRTLLDGRCASALIYTLAVEDVPLECRGVWRPDPAPVVEAPDPHVNDLDHTDHELLTDCGTVRPELGSEHCHVH